MTETNLRSVSGIEFSMIVNLPENAADTICRSIDLLALAIKSYLNEVGHIQRYQALIYHERNSLKGEGNNLKGKVVATLPSYPKQ